MLDGARSQEETQRKKINFKSSIRNNIWTSEKIYINTKGIDKYF